LLCLYYCPSVLLLFFFNDTATSDIYTLSLHDALPISKTCRETWRRSVRRDGRDLRGSPTSGDRQLVCGLGASCDPFQLRCRIYCDRKGVSFRMRLPLLWACGHLEWDVDLTHRLVDSTGLRRSFETVGEQV